MSIYMAEKMLESMSKEDLYHTLFGIAEEDYYAKDFQATETTDNFLYMLEIYELVFVASNGRILLTPKGQKMLLKLDQMLI